MPPPQLGSPRPSTRLPPLRDPRPRRRDPRTEATHSIASPGAPEGEPDGTQTPTQTRTHAYEQLAWIKGLTVLVRGGSRPPLEHGCSTLSASIQAGAIWSRFGKSCEPQRQTTYEDVTPSFLMKGSARPQATFRRLVYLAGAWLGRSPSTSRRKRPWQSGQIPVTRPRWSVCWLSCTGRPAVPEQLPGGTGTLG